MGEVHNVQVSLGTQMGVSLVANAIRVTRPDELRSALTQHTRPIVIDDPTLARTFARAFWDGSQGTFRALSLLSAGLIALSISLQYKLDLNWRAKWKQVTMEGHFALTPVGETARTNSDLDRTVHAAPVNANGTPPIWERLAKIGSTVPIDSWKEVPADLSTNVDRYLYGTKEKH